MICFVTALIIEARPLIERFNLKRDNQFKEFELFKGDNIALIVSGVGKTKSADATAALATYLEDPSELTFVNFGTAGSKALPVGSLHICNKIYDNNSERTWHLKLPPEHGLNEVSLETHDKAVSSENDKASDAQLVDMEASGFYEAASRFVPANHINVLKIVSDRLSDKAFSKKFVIDLISNQLSSIEDYLKRLHYT